jgi:hypothetical protein
MDSMAGFRIRARALVVACGLLALLPAGASASTGVSTRIVGGTSAANPGWIAYLDIAFAGGDSLCGGELIAKSWVLTAAHCVTNDGTTTVVAPGAVTAWIGLNNLSDSDTDPGVSVDQVIVDPAYNVPTLDGDVALLHLTSPSSREPVPLGGPNDPAVGSVPSVLGWGVTDIVSQALSDVLKTVSARILDPSACAALEQGYDAASKLCAGGGLGEDSCSGDSGGPLTLAPGTSLATLVGTVDYGSEFCGDGQPSVYQRLTSGPVAAFLAANAPTVHLGWSGGAPGLAQVGTVTASPGHFTNPVFAWDLDADSQYDDATGSSAALRASNIRTSVAVRVTGDGEVAAQRTTLVSGPGAVAVTAPAEIREGDEVVLRVTPVPGALGSLLAGISGAGVVAGYSQSTATVNGSPTTLTARFDDEVWQGDPWTMKIDLTSTGLTLATPKTLSVRVIDNDLPKLDYVEAKRRGKRGILVMVHAPGYGKVSVSALRGKHVLVRKRVATSTTSEPTTALLRLSRASVRRLKGSKPVIKVTWRSGRVTGAKASRTLRGPRLPRP